MIVTVITVLLPVFFVLGLGYFAGRAKQFDADQIRGFNELVLDYALPAMMFVATVKTPRDQLLGEGRYALALLVAFVGLFLIVVLVSTRVLHRSLGEAALQANLASFPSVAFFGPPIFQGLFGASSLVSIALSAVLSTIAIVPLTLVLLEIHRQRAAGGEAQQLSSLILQSLANTFQQPMVWAPLIGVALVLVGVHVPVLSNNSIEDGIDCWHGVSAAAAVVSACNCVGLDPSASTARHRVSPGRESIAQKTATRKANPVYRR